MSKERSTDVGYRLDRYVTASGASSPEYGTADEALYFQWGVTGRPQLWRLDSPKAWPERCTSLKAGTGASSLSPDGSSILLATSPEGGSNTSFHRYDVESGFIELLTDDFSARHYFGDWNDDGTEIVFLSDRHHDGRLGVYRQPISIRGAVDLIYTTKTYMTIEDWSCENDCILMRRSKGIFDDRLYALDPDDGSLQQLTPTEPARYLSPTWGPDGGLYCVTDYDDDFLYVAEIRRGGPGAEPEPIFGMDQSNVEAIGVDEATGLAAMFVNENGYSRLIVGRMADGKFERTVEPSLPDGAIGGASFGMDGETIAISVRSEFDTTDIYVIDLLDGGHTQWTRTSMVDISSDDRRSRVVRYESKDGLDVPALVMDPAVDGRTPLLIDLHGGPAAQHRPKFRPFVQYLVDKGWVVIQPNVRGSTGYGRSFASLDDREARFDAVDDVKAAVEWARREYLIDEDSIVVYGVSYGGLLALLAMIEYPRLWAAGVEISGITDWVKYLNQCIDSKREIREREYGSLSSDMELLQRLSPHRRASEIDCPVFIAHGENDPQVPVSEAKRFEERLEQDDTTVRSLYFEGEGHRIVDADNQLVLYRAIDDFLHRTIR